MQKAHTIERNELIVEMYKSGKTALEIAALTHLSETAVKIVLRNAGVSIAKTPSLLGEAIAEMLMNGMTNTDISKELGCSKPTVTYYKKLLGVPLGYSGAVTKEEVKIMEDLRYNSGLCDKEIAARVNRRVQTVHRHIGRQDAPVTEFYRTAARESSRAYSTAQIKTRRYYKEKLRAEAERLERERIEALRVAKENKIKEMLAALGIPADSINIESVESGNALLNNLITRATELTAGA